MHQFMPLIITLEEDHGQSLWMTICTCIISMVLLLKQPNQIIIIQHLVNRVLTKLQYGLQFLKRHGQKSKEII